MAAVWSNLNPSLSESTLEVLDAMGFKTMTPVQVTNIVISYIVWNKYSCNANVRED